MAASVQPMIKLAGKHHISGMSNALLNLLSFGFLYLISRLSPTLGIRFKTSPCVLSEADCVVLEDQYGNFQLIRTKKIQAQSTLVLSRYIKDQHVTILDTCYGRFIYDYKVDKFVSPVYIHGAKKGFDGIYQAAIIKSREEEKIENYEKRIIFGKNDLGVRIPTLGEIFEAQFLAPLFIWEVISLVIWVSVCYYIYAAVVGCIFFIIFIIGLIGDIRNRSNLIKNHKISQIRVLREGSFKAISEVEALPGDIIYIDSSDSFTCDVEILKGDVIVDESFLTGESVPVCKGPGSIVYSGTKIIKSTSTTISLNNVQMEKLVKVKNLTKKSVSEPLVQVPASNNLDDIAIGVVVKTGKRTKRGLLFKNLAIKKPSTNKFAIQSLKVIQYLITASISLLVGFFFYLKYENVIPSKVCRYSFDLALTFFSPALYTSLELGAQYARGQLLGKKVNTTDISRINTAGEVDLIVFDKTGTLTELGVDVLCFDTIKKSIEDVNDLDYAARMALSTCHYVLELDNQYSGDILDMKMFMFSQSKIINRDNKRFIEMEVKNKYQAICKEYTGKEDGCTLFFNAENSSSSSSDVCPEDTLEVLKIYDFDLYLKRLSVVVKNNEGRAFLFCKGAPDSVSKILSSVPKAYSEKVRDYGLEGHRVLTVACKEISNYSGNRTTDETDLEFLGFLVFANKLKDETMNVISELREANLNPKMCTGDNILTAISVAKECGMIDKSTPVLFPVLEEGCKSYYDVDWYCVADEDYIFDKIKMQLYYEINRAAASDFAIAVEGKEFEYFKSSNYYNFILEKGVVFARFNPDNKKDLIEEYSRNSYVTMFCGDGANDTGALCSADVGVSLAVNEASLAASFNSLNLSAVLDVVKEGRSALSMSASQFKYIFYSQVLAGVQMVSLLPKLYFPSDGMSLINDLMSCYALAYSLSHFKAATKIHPRKISIDIRTEALYITIELLVTLLVFLVTSYTISPESPAHVTKVFKSVILESRNSAAIFISTMLLLIYRPIKFANFGPHRQSRRTNKLFISILGFCAVIGVFIISMILTQYKPVLTFLKAKPLTQSDVIKAALCAIVSFGITFVMDNVNFSKMEKLDSSSLSSGP